MKNPKGLYTRLLPPFTRPGWHVVTFPCPNDPPCSHSGLIHDIYDGDDIVPRCCADGCDCGRTP